MTFVRLLNILAASLLLFSAVAMAQSSQADIKAMVETYLQGKAQQQQVSPSTRIEVEANPLDPRLNLPTCSVPLKLIENERHHRPGRQTVRIECAGSHPWGIYVTANIRIFRPVVIANQLINKKAPITNDVLRLEERNIAELRGGYYTNFNALTHTVAKRMIRPGQALAPTHVKAREVVQKGDFVTITAKGQQLSVKMSGTALSDGKINQQIRVRNNRSERIIKATVTGPKQVEVQM
ncbi:flagellar basal body P-ring formation protein FlgA [Aestuariirhabdus sp. Z084]|uniref:flagellar basal body P-ring formation chaperone FlgA n=1 Tax=Aestuariirhabdus haliotis TaxID=2918751 RepID=UPI00201B45A7|nr:flagellar basal body P-ring formation chaperone FlgA [Aestuariirhabdus haliotis]MCL6414437.1 flagellar basal body P-ring formation protein FlgA [Aestuariirhabdus haliotis]MCL6418581.1 flagellar basal body P-ring formation protein FlgA [Aestuariirhabdus haliotis]